MTSPATGAAWAGRLLTIALAIASASVAFRLSSPAVLGSHDEGVYIAGARALASGQGYRLINLPSAPRQTKYPPAYSALLTLASPAMASDPDDFKRLKIVNAVCLAVIVVLTGALAGRLSNGSPVAVVAAALLASTSLALVSYVDLVGSDVLFVALALGSILVMPLSPSTTRAGFAGVVLGLAVLTRMAGIPVAIGAALWLGARHRREAAILALTCAVIASGWVVWATLARDGVSNALERYYTQYDHFAWTDALGHPAYAWSVVASNTANYAQALPPLLGTPTIGLTLLVLAGIVAGIWTTRRHPLHGLLASMALPYALLIVGFAVVIVRYLLPVVPLACAWLGCSVATFADRGRTERSKPPWLGVCCVAIALVANVLEVAHYAHMPAPAVHVGLGQYLPFDRHGFLETADWIRRSTPESAVIASANDTFYYVHTGRRGVRPWPYEPDRYNAEYSPVGAGATTETVLAHLDQLGVTYLVLDPYLPDLEGRHATQFVTAILRSGCWTPVFETAEVPLAPRAPHRVFARCQSRDASHGQ